MYTVRIDIPEDRRKQLLEAAVEVVPNGFTGSVSVEIVNGKARRVFERKEED